MKRTILSLLMMAGLHQAQAQCNAIVVDAPSQNFADKRCVGTPLALYAYATGGTNMNYTWYKDGVEITTASNDNQHDILSLIPSDGGVYTVKITSAECPSGITPPYTYTIQVDTGLPPTVGLTSISSLNPCVGTSNSYYIGIANEQLYDWTWNVPNGWTGSSTTNAITLTVGDTSTSVFATATNGCGSRNYGFASVVPIAGDPTALDNINLHFGQLCEGNEVYLSVNSTPGDNYLWQFPEGWVQTPYPVVGIVTVTVVSSGTVTVKGYNACSADTVTYSQFISVSPPLPTPLITQVGNTLQTTAVAASYSWYEYYENYIGDTTIVGPTGNVYTPKVNGTFILYISDANGCTAESDTIRFNGLNVGIGETENAVYAIYPNPATDVINIKAENSIDLRITDLQGRLVYTAANVSGVHTIPTSAMSNGIYMVHSGNGKQIQTTKLLIAK